MCQRIFQLQSGYLPEWVHVEKRRFVETTNVFRLSRRQVRDLRAIRRSLGRKQQETGNRLRRLPKGLFCKIRGVHNLHDLPAWVLQISC